MVRERRASHHAKPRASQSLWDSQRMKVILAQPVGTPITVEKQEAREILLEHLKSPGEYDRANAERQLREFKKIRRMWGSVADLNA